MRLLKRVDYKLKVHLIVNTASMLEFQSRKHKGGWSLPSIGWAFYSYGIQSRPQKVLVCANEKLMWNQAESFCKERIVSSIPRWLQYVLSRQQVSSAPTKAVRSTPGNQTTCMLYLQVVSVPDLLDKEKSSRWIREVSRHSLVVDAVNQIALDRTL